jgi:YD repeat-containing protein
VDNQRAGSTQESDGVTGTINFGRSIAGEITSITNATYQNAPYNPANLVSNVSNGPDGPVSYTLGNGLNVYRTYDTLGRWWGQWVCNGPAAANCSGGTQVYGTVGAWKGSQMQSQADTVLNQQIAYGYDGFNRLSSRTVTSGTLQNYTYGYDIYGNRVSQTALQTGYNFNPTINPANNRITTSGYTYDAAGNMTNDTVHSYTYDAEGNITKVDGGSTAMYVYDAFNQRVHVRRGVQPRSIRMITLGGGFPVGCHPTTAASRAGSIGMASSLGIARRMARRTMTIRIRWGRNAYELPLVPGPGRALRRFPGATVIRQTSFSRAQVKTTNISLVWSMMRRAGRSMRSSVTMLQRRDDGLRLTRIWVATT